MVKSQVYFINSLQETDTFKHVRRSANREKNIPLDWTLRRLWLRRKQTVKKQNCWIPDNNIWQTDRDTYVCVSVYMCVCALAGKLSTLVFTMIFFFLRRIFLAI